MSAAPVEVAGVALGEPLGSGGFGTVYRARHLSLDVEVAVKLMDAGAFAERERAQLLREAQLMARLDHPNLLRVFDAGRVGRYVYLVLELMDGGSCGELRRVDPELARSLAFQLLSGLQALHEARVLHRDIKPANCLRRARDQRVKLADLGLAVEWGSRKEPSYGTAGTLPFMAPELLQSPPRFSPASDLYALGMTLACLVLDEAPFPRSSAAELLVWIVSGPRPRVSQGRPDLSPALVTLIDRMISARVEDRPESATAALAALAAGERERPAVRTAGAEAAVGPWVLGDVVYDSSNWKGFAVTHVRSGAPGRLMQLQPAGPLAEAGELVLLAARRASRLVHPHVVPVLDWGLWQTRPYVVTAARGCTLEELVRAKGPCDELLAVRFLADLAAGVGFLHAQGLVYQNVDPGAAVIGHDARSAQLSWPVYCVPRGSGQGDRILVPRFAAPEAMFGFAPTIEPEVDRFGLGAVIYFLLTGAIAPRNLESGQLAAQLRQAAPEVTAPTAHLAGDLLQANPEARPSAAEARERAEAILRQYESASALPPTLRL